MALPPRNPTFVREGEPGKDGMGAGQTGKDCDIIL